MSDDTTQLGRTQSDHWDRTFFEHPQMYGDQPSDPARYAAALFAACGLGTVLELGSGHGRDTVHLARSAEHVYATDLSAIALGQLRRAATDAGVGDRVTTLEHDVRRSLPLPDRSVDAVYAHMLLCMALSTAELEALLDDVRRVLRPGGVLVHTVRHTGDAHYGQGIDHGDDIWEHGGFAVHFFDDALVRRLAEGWNLEEVHPFEEGALPRRLWRVTQTLD